MPHADPTLLITRPRAASDRFRAACEARLGRSIPAVIAPAIEIEHIGDGAVHQHYAAVIFTSSHAVASAGQGAGRLAFCVGDRTAENAAAVGFDARSASGTAEDLIALIKESAPKGRLLHVRGEQSRGEIAVCLTAAGFPTDERVVYRQVARAIPATVWAGIVPGSELIVPIFSPFSADALSRTLPQGAFSLTIVAISEAAAAQAPGPADRMIVAARPDGATMADEVAALYRPRAAC